MTRWLYAVLLGAAFATPARAGVLEPGESATFRYRVLVSDGPRTREQLEAEYAEYAE